MDLCAPANVPLCAPPEDTITVLNHRAGLATKTLRLSSDGTVEIVPFDKKLLLFDTFELPFRGLTEFFRALTTVASLRTAMIIRGKRAHGVPDQNIRRTTHARDGAKASFVEVPRRWLALDLDTLDDGSPWHDIPGKFTRAIASLPAECQGVSCMYQVSSSAGFRQGKLGHLWYLLDAPHGQKSLTAWGNSFNERVGKHVIDTSLFRTIQPHYTADPVFELSMGTDPFAGRRWGVIYGARETLSLPVRPEAKGDWRGFLERLKQPDNAEIHRWIRDACGRFFLAYGADADSAILKRELTLAVGEALRLQGRSDYGEGQLDNEISSGRDYARRQGATGGALILSDRGQPAALLSNVITALSTDEWRGLRWNSRTEKVEVGECPIDGVRGVLDEHDLTWVAKYMQDTWEIHTSTLLVREAVAAVARQRAYDPARDTLESLEWDGVPRLDTWLRDWLGVEESTYSCKVGAMALISACARVMLPSSRVHETLLLIGQEATNKSTVCELLGKALFDGGYSSLAEDIGKREASQALIGPVIVEIEELRAISGSSAEAVRQFMSRESDRYRAPYDRDVADHPRRCIFIATSNEHGILEGDHLRRWHPVEVRAMWSNDEIRRFFPARELWAEALVRFRAGERWSAVPGEFREQQRAERAETEGDSYESTLPEILAKGRRACFDMLSPGIPPNAEEVTITDVLLHGYDVEVPRQTAKQKRCVGKALRKLGWLPGHVNTRGDSRGKSCYRRTQST